MASYDETEPRPPTAPPSGDAAARAASRRARLRRGPPARRALRARASAALRAHRRRVRDPPPTNPIPANVHLSSGAPGAHAAARAAARVRRARVRARRGRGRRAAHAGAAARGVPSLRRIARVSSGGSPRASTRSRACARPAALGAREPPGRPAAALHALGRARRRVRLRRRRAPAARLRQRARGRAATTLRVERSGDAFFDGGLPRRSPARLHPVRAALLAARARARGRARKTPLPRGRRLGPVSLRSARSAESRRSSARREDGPGRCGMAIRAFACARRPAARARRGGRAEHERESRAWTSKMRYGAPSTSARARAAWPTRARARAPFGRASLVAARPRRVCAGFRASAHSRSSRDEETPGKRDGFRELSRRSARSRR